MTVGGRKRYKVTLTDDERTQLQDLVDRGKGSKERRKRAHILLLADTGRDRGGRIDADIADALGVNRDDGRAGTQALRDGGFRRGIGPHAASESTATIAGWGRRGHLDHAGVFTTTSGSGQLDTGIAWRPGWWHLTWLTRFRRKRSGAR